METKLDRYKTKSGTAVSQHDVRGENDTNALEPECGKEGVIVEEKFKRDKNEGATGWFGEACGQVSKDEHVR